MSCELCGHTEGQHYYNEDGSSQGAFYSCIAEANGTVDGKCGCIEYREFEPDDEDE